jgi:hypothetical protein
MIVLLRDGFSGTPSSPGSVIPASARPLPQRRLGPERRSLPPITSGSWTNSITSCSLFDQ